MTNMQCMVIVFVLLLHLTFSSSFFPIAYPVVQDFEVMLYLRKLYSTMRGIAKSNDDLRHVVLYVDMDAL